MEDITWQKLAMNMLAGVALILGVLALLMLRHLFNRDTDVVQRQYLCYCAKLAKHGMVRAAHEGARDFAARASAAMPQHTHIIHDITTRYLALRYENSSDPASLHAFKGAISAFKL
jgi:hypothetical protein